MSEFKEDDGKPKQASRGLPKRAKRHKGMGKLRERSKAPKSIGVVSVFGGFRVLKDALGSYRAANQGGENVD